MSRKSALCSSISVTEHIGLEDDENIVIEMMSIRG